MKTATAPVVLIKDTSFEGIYLRNNLNDASKTPAAGPYGLCPDIIQSSQPLTDPAAILGTKESWNEMYDIVPYFGQDNYFYVRGINNTEVPATSQVKLYYTPAQLILLPETWQQQPLQSAAGADYVNVKAGAGGKAVAQAPFAWPDTPAPDAGSDFYSFIAQSTGADGTENPVPVVSSWLDMSDLVLNQPAFACRNSCQVSNNTVSWERQFMLTIPAAIADPGTLQISITTTGMEGNTLSLMDNTLNNIVDIKPYVVANDGDATVYNFQPRAGLSTSLSLKYVNTAAGQPAAGAGITVSISYQVPPSAVYEAGVRGLLDHQYAKKISTQLGIPIEQYAILGAVTFLVD